MRDAITCPDTPPPSTRPSTFKQQTASGPSCHNNHSTGFKFLHPSPIERHGNCILHPSSATEIASQTYQFDTPIWYYHYLCIDQLLPFSKHYFSFLHNPRFQTFLHPGRPAGSKLRMRSNIESLSISCQQMPFAKLWRSKLGGGGRKWA